MFKSIKDAESFYNINNIFSCCNNKIKSAGKHPKTGEPLIWMYYKDYLKFNK
jgi:hypothetical protein